jgi:hypothetical protein
VFRRIIGTTKYGILFWACKRKSAENLLAGRNGNLLILQGVITILLKLSLLLSVLHFVIFSLVPCIDLPV